MFFSNNEQWSLVIFIGGLNCCQIGPFPLGVAQTYIKSQYSVFTDSFKSQPIFPEDVFWISNAKVGINLFMYLGLELDFCGLT